MSLSVPQPLTLPMKFDGSSDMLATCPSCETGTEEKLQQKAKVDRALVFPKAMPQDGPVFTFT